VDDRGINLYNTLLRESEGFRAYIKKIAVPIEWVDMILNEIRLGKKTGVHLAQELGIESQRLLVLLRTLKLRGIILIWM
jgi:hypothetical protein